MHLESHFPKYLLDYISQLLDQADIGITVTDPKKHDNPIVYANDFFYSMFGYSHEDIIDKNCRFLHAKDIHQENLNSLKKAIKEQEPNSLYWSDEIYNLFEIDKNAFEATYEAFLNAIHPDDRTSVNDAYTLSLKTQEKYSIQHRLLMKDGKVKYVEEQCQNYFDQDGVAIRSVSTVQDITYIKSVELELQKTLSFLKGHKLAIDESSIVSKSDKHVIITYVNKNF